jgi:hypothetical protein
MGWMAQKSVTKYCTGRRENLGEDETNIYRLSASAVDL